MKARIPVCVDEELLEEIDVQNGLRQGCTIAPALFNLYACTVFERWLTKIKGMEGVGTYIHSRWIKSYLEGIPRMHKGAHYLIVNLLMMLYTFSYHM